MWPTKAPTRPRALGLPVPVLTCPTARCCAAPRACQALRTRQPLQLDPAAMAVPMDKYHELLTAAKAKGPTFPATNPPTFYQQLDREALYDIYLGNPPNPDARKSEGGFYPNLDNQYIRTILNRKLGKVFVLRAKAPTTPRTWQRRCQDGRRRAALLVVVLQPGLCQHPRQRLCF